MFAEKEVAAPAPSINTDPIFVAIEMSRSKWVVGTHIPTSSKVGIHTVEWGDAAALLALVERLRSRAADVVGIAAVPVLCCYEAGYEGFWLYRRLAAAGLRVLVIDPSSLLVNRRAKRAKTDRIDAKAMIRALMAYNRGEDQVLSAVIVPSVEQEDHRRLVRERQSLVYDCTAHTNRIRGLLLTQGIVGFDPRASGAERQLDELVTGDGRSLGPRLKDEMRREIGRLRVVLEQLKDVSAERDAIALGKTIETPHRDQGLADADAAMIASLARIKGVGPNDASVLVREAFWRKFNNRRELAAWSGLAPMPWASGTVSRDQGIAKTGPAIFRSHMLQIAWRWLHHQPQSRLSQWFNERTNGAAGRVRRVMIVALARKLLVALWRYATAGLVPTGAIVA
ncbi:IS110 family RNA-guided transposase [Acidibrevibacterium fodinaquatile]|uniref:IS110 family transposase n=2 Tax=Acidibrevibacterium fodinaquatile TaxID=1969806 RepID=UPI0019667555|nr:IS110 family transposase [Acidibrevibacterium fodinaquatile]